MGCVFSLSSPELCLLRTRSVFSLRKGQDAVVISQSTTCHFRVSFLLRFDDNSMTTVLSGTSRYPQPSTASQSIAACFCLGKPCPTSAELGQFETRIPGADQGKTVSTVVIRPWLALG